MSFKAETRKTRFNSQWRDMKRMKKLSLRDSSQLARQPSQGRIGSTPPHTNTHTHAHTPITQLPRSFFWESHNTNSKFSLDEFLTTVARKKDLFSPTQCARQIVPQPAGIFMEWRTKKEKKKVNMSGIYVVAPCLFDSFSAGCDFDKHCNDCD